MKNPARHTTWLAAATAALLAVSACGNPDVTDPYADTEQTETEQTETETVVGIEPHAQNLPTPGATERFVNATRALCDLGSATAVHLETWRSTSDPDEAVRLWRTFLNYYSSTAVGVETGELAATADPDVEFVWAYIVALVSTESLLGEPGYDQLSHPEAATRLRALRSACLQFRAPEVSEHSKRAVAALCDTYRQIDDSIGLAMVSGHERPVVHWPTFTTAVERTHKQVGDGDLLLGGLTATLLDTFVYLVALTPETPTTSDFVGDTLPVTLELQARCDEIKDW